MPLISMGLHRCSKENSYGGDSATAPPVNLPVDEEGKSEWRFTEGSNALPGRLVQPFLRGKASIPSCLFRGNRLTVARQPMNTGKSGPILVLPIANYKAEATG
jgi:hypothetical protein